MNKPKIRFKGYTEGWEQRKFVNVFSGLQNNTLSRAEMSDKGTIKNVHYGDVLIKYGSRLDASSDDIPFIADSRSVEKYSASFLQDGDIIIADTAEDTTVGKCTEIQGSDGYKLLSGLHTIPCRPNEKYAPGYMGYYMNSAAYHDQLIPLMQGIKVTSISKSALQETDLMFPKKYEEQEKIGSYFQSLDHLITLHQRKCEQTKTLKKYMLQKMFPQDGASVPEIRFEGFTEAWKQRKVSELGDIVTGNTPPTKDKDNYDGAYLFVSPADIQGNRYVEKTITTLTEKGFNLGRKLSPGSTLFVSIGSTIGKVAQIKDFAISNQQINAVMSSSDYDDDFVFTAFENISPTIKALAAQQAVPIVNKTTFSGVELSVPQIEEQAKIGEFFTNLDTLITLHQRKCEELQKIKKYMLQNMFV